MNNQPVFLLVFLSFVLLVSGCTFTQVEVTSNGVEVESFEPDFSNPYSGESVMFRMLMRNTGSSDALVVSANVLGLENTWTQSNVNCDTTNLLAPDVLGGIPGGAHQCSWTYKAPTLSTGQSITYDVTGRVLYRYSSATTTIVTFGSYDEIRNLQDSGQGLPAQTTHSSEGPIEIVIQINGPIRFDENENGVDFPLYITVNNLGGGTVCNTDNPTECEEQDIQGKVSLEFSADDVTFTGCNRVMSLLSGTNSYSCDAKATGLQNQVLTQRTITASTSYSYYSDVETAVTVSGQ
jgi:hypothetical protein